MKPQMNLPETPVALLPCRTYDPEEVYPAFRRAFEEAGLREEEVRGKHVLLKPNLVMAKKPEAAATSHPATVEACAKLLSAWGAAKITLADSPGGPFSPSALAVVYRVCGLAPLAGKYGLILNQDCSADPVYYKEGEALKSFRILHVIQEADVVIDLCKLKTHSLTGMSGATKNLFGMIPGVEKLEMHATFSTVDAFSVMLCDLASYLLSTGKTFLALCDGIVGMEGNGPSHGEPKEVGVVLASRSPFALDVAAEHLIGCDGSVKYLDVAAKRGLVPRTVKELSVRGLADTPVCPFKKPDNTAGVLLKKLPDFMGGRFAAHFEARPKVDPGKCVGCGVCVQSCPRHTIVLRESRGKKTAAIDRTACIKCYCCQELCPAGAVKTYRHPLVRLIH